MTGSEFNMSNTEEAIVSVGSACDTKWADGVRFAGNGNSNYATSKFGVKGNGWSKIGYLLYSVNTLKDTLFGENGRLDVKDTYVSTSKQLVAAVDGEPQNGTELIQKLTPTLTDNPVTPEVILSFTLPDGGNEQRLPMGSFVGVVNIGAVDSTLTTRLGMSIYLHVNMFKYPAATNATAAVSVISSVGAFGSPAFDVTTSGNDVNLRVTMNPSGGSFANGIKGVVSGTLTHASTSSLFKERIQWS